MLYNEYSKISICTSCMDRNDMLIQTIPSWLKIPVKEIIIVDWSSKKPVIETLEENNIYDNRITIARVNDKKYYEHSLARNLKVFLCKTEWVLSVDSDVKIFESFFEEIYKLTGKKLYCLPFDSINNSCFGTTLFRKIDYTNVGGCNTKMKGWGYEDMDLNQRLVESGCVHIKLNPNNLYHIPHDDSRRVENCLLKNKWESNSLNMYHGSKPFDNIWKEPNVEFELIKKEL